MSDGCREYGRDTCAGCERFWECDKNEDLRAFVKDMKNFERTHEGQRFRRSYGKCKRKSAASLKIKR